MEKLIDPDRVWLRGQLPKDDPNGVRVTNLSASRLADAVEGAGPLMDHFGWLLAQY